VTYLYERPVVPVALEYPEVNGHPRDLRRARRIFDQLPLSTDELVFGDHARLPFVFSTEPLEDNLESRRVFLIAEPAKRPRRRRSGKRMQTFSGPRRIWSASARWGESPIRRLNASCRPDP
jgi:hypothetical protein